jgi:Ca2+-binding RTX toxin-like protein
MHLLRAPGVRVRRGLWVDAAAVLVLAGGVVLAAPGTAFSVDSCSGQQATIVGTSGPDILIGTSGADVIKAFAGNDVINGAGGDDVICGDEGVDTILGGDGDDEIHAGAGDDRLAQDIVLAVRGGAGNDEINGDAGNDAINGEDGDDVIDGDNGDDHLEGSDGNDRISGDSGDDTVCGDALVQAVCVETPVMHGADDLFGGPDDDVLDGGLELLLVPHTIDDANGEGGTDICNNVDSESSCEV